MKNEKIKWNICILWILIGTASSTILTLIFNYTGLVSDPAFQKASQGLFSLSSYVPVLVIMYCLISPAIEEVLFRFFLFGFIFQKTGNPALSILITAALFGIYHLNPVQMLYAFIMGLVITYGYYRHRNILIPILTHAAANAVALLFTFR